MSLLPGCVLEIGEKGARDLLFVGPDGQTPLSWNRVLLLICGARGDLVARRSQKNFPHQPLDAPTWTVLCDRSPPACGGVRRSSQKDGSRREKTGKSDAEQGIVRIRIDRLERWLSGRKRLIRNSGQASNLGHFRFARFRHVPLDSVLLQPVRHNGQHNRRNASCAWISSPTVAWARTLEGRTAPVKHGGPQGPSCIPPAMQLAHGV